MSELSSYISVGGSSIPTAQRDLCPLYVFFQAKLLNVFLPLVSRPCTGPAVVLLRGQEAQKQNQDILAPSPFPVEGQARKQIKWITLNPD